MYFLCDCISEPTSCADVKYYRNKSLDGNYTIYPYTIGQLPVRVYCAKMNTSEPKEYINLLQGEDKNFALINGDKAYLGTCNIIPNVLTDTWMGPKVGHTRYSKVCFNNEIFVDGDLCIGKSNIHYTQQFHEILSYLRGNFFKCRVDLR